MSAHAADRNAEVELTPTEFGTHGDGIARDADGRVVSIPGAIPGERVRIKPLARRRGVVHAQVVDVLEPSPDRAEPPCPEVANGCGACQWQHIDVDAQQAYKRMLVAQSLGLVGETALTRLRPTVALPAAGFRTTVHAAVHHGPVCG